VSRLIGIAGGLLLLSAPALGATLQILTPDDVTITEKGPCATIRVGFSFPVRYVKHFPPVSGAELRIQFEPIAVSPADRKLLFTRRSVRVPRSEIASLVEVVYEGDVAGGPFLTLVFSRPRRFTAEQGGDFRSLVIIVRGEGALADCPKISRVFGRRNHIAGGPQPPTVAPPPSPAPAAPTPAIPAPAEPAPAEPTPTAPTPVLEERLAALMEEAGRAMTRGDYRQAVEYYTALLEYPPHAYSERAQELLGLARERAGQMAHARAEYEKYLRLHPQGEGADRVRQRLAGLLTATAKPPERLREARPAARPTTTELHGSFSQFYYRFDNFPDEGGNVITRSLLSTYLDLVFRRRAQRYELSSVLNGGYDQDFLDSDRSAFRLNRFYVDFADRPLGISARVGRQTRSTDGVLGRFDGAVLGYQLLKPVRVNALIGFPAERARVDDFDTDRHFEGLSLDLGTFAGRWNFNLYGIRQEAEGLLDREAVGIEGRYVDSSLSAFALLDYDIPYRELNTVLTTATWVLPDQTTLTLAFDQRKSPVLITRNALIGQPESSLSALRRTLSESQVRQLAEDRTATSRSLMLGIAHPFDQDLQVGGDVTVSETTGTPASRGVPASPGSGYDYAASIQVIGSSLIKAGDIAILGLRYAYVGSIETIGASLNTRYPVNSDWRINPRLQVDYRQHHHDGTDDIKLRPVLAMDYYLMRRARLELEAGLDWTPRWFSNDSENLDTFLTIGYRVDF
jgi:tetratricopeptide (TPR) repeat protein